VTTVRGETKTPSIEKKRNRNRPPLRLAAQDEQKKAKTSSTLGTTQGGGTLGSEKKEGLTGASKGTSKEKMRGAL